jgi:hypothetical protein
MRARRYFVICTLFFVSNAQASPPAPCDEASSAIAAVATDGSAAKVVQAALTQAVRDLPNPAWAPGYCRAVSDNLARKALSKAEGVRFDADLLTRTALKYEAFRIKAFRDSGVAPKLYAGFLDGVGATANYEKTLLRVAGAVAPFLNAYAQKVGSSARVSAKEIAVTQIAEGGALLLTTRLDHIDQVPPVQGVGLDDYRIGFRRFTGLAEEIDRAFGSHLASMKGGPDDKMTFEESILGTAVMYFYEKDLAEQKLRAEKRPSLANLPLDEQFVAASLVYNSGILFSDERIKQILGFATGAYLADISERSAPKRPRLPVMTPEAADAFLAEGKSLPEQNTSWNAVYHVLQRYGAWVALTRFADMFAADGSVSNLRTK